MLSVAKECVDLSTKLFGDGHETANALKNYGSAQMLNVRSAMISFR